MATQAQLDEKARQDRRGVTAPTFEEHATPAQLAEKARHNSSTSQFATAAQLEEKRGRSTNPLSPFHESSSNSYEFSPPAPPPYNADDAKRSALISEQWRSRDPRSNSTSSLVPSESGRDGRRTLLLIYIHGFNGNETSFQSFPAHVHNLLTIQLAATHVVHTKIYPRYRSRKTIDFARDDFSKWLEPNEQANAEVVLLGHSMGGLLSAEVALSRAINGQGFRHRILGTINFDTPFLGMHPGVVVSGIGSLFRPAPEPTAKPAQSSTASDYVASPGSSTYTPSISDASSQWTNMNSPLTSPSVNDPNYNPPFPNDVRLAERKGWSSVIHFLNKHADDFTTATKQYVTSHIEFGGTMADYPALKNRYAKIRALEDVDDITRQSGPGYVPPATRIRFVNYYTASTGRPKVPKATKSEEKLPESTVDENGIARPIEVEMKDMTLEASQDHSERSPTPTPKISVEVHDRGEVIPQPLEDAPDASPLSPIKAQMQELGENSGVQNDVQESKLAPMQHIDSMPIEDDDLYSAEESQPIPTTEPTTDHEVDNGDQALESVTSEQGLPPIPPMPREPLPFNPDAYAEKDARKLAEKEHKRIMKVYNQSIKDRESAIKDRRKYVEKKEKKAKQEEEKRLKAEEKQRLREEKQEEKRRMTINPEPRNEAQRRGSTATTIEDNKPKRDKKFCMLPPESGGKRDKTWIRVFMEGVDEVGAHCGLFFPGPQYESLVGDVGERISNWVEHDATRRAIEEAERGY